MQHFATTRRTLAILHIYSPDAYANFHRFNPINSTIFIFSILATILTGMFFALEAETFDDYSNAIFACSCAGLLACVLLILINKTKTVYEFFNTVEGHIRKRESLSDKPFLSKIML